jgi:RNA 3'-terminal phosphate cyclase (ATP)
MASSGSPAPAAPAAAGASSEVVALTSLLTALTPVGALERGEPLVLDGSQGEGGGQVLRTSLSLSAITGQPIRLVRIRGRRSKPGLQQQHLTCVRAAAQVCGAVVTGAVVGSSEISFTPGPGGLQHGAMTFDIGTAGSTTLVLQTVLPALLRAGGPSEVTIIGGTHNPMAPPFDFLANAFVPLLRRLGASVELECPRYGFYPAGGGRIVARIQPLPASPSPLALLERGAPGPVSALAIVANLKPDIAKREADVVRASLRLAPGAATTLCTKAADGPGNAVIITLPFEHVTEVVSALGERGVKAEDVAGNAVADALTYLVSGAPVGEHLADQLLLPLALAAGGTFITDARPRSEHFATNAAALHAFTTEPCVTWLEREVAAAGSAGGESHGAAAGGAGTTKQWVVTVAPARLRVAAGKH